MTNRNTPPALTPQAQQLLAIVQRAGGGWVNRSAIAAALEKPRLHVWHIALLDKLAGYDLIEKRKTQVQSPVGYEWQYRAK